jgi:hypothetical protein
VYRQVGPAEVQTQTPCNLIGRRLCCRPAVFFRLLRLTALALRNMKMCRVSKMLRVYFYNFFFSKNCVCLTGVLKSRKPVGVCVCACVRTYQQQYKSPLISFCPLSETLCHCADSNDQFQNCVAVKGRQFWVTAVTVTGTVQRFLRSSLILSQQGLYYTLAYV